MREHTHHFKGMEIKHTGSDEEISRVAKRLAENALEKGNDFKHLPEKPKLRGSALKGHKPQKLEKYSRAEMMLVARDMYMNNQTLQARDLQKAIAARLKCSWNKVFLILRELFENGMVRRCIRPTKEK